MQISDQICKATLSFLKSEHLWQVTIHWERDGNSFLVKMSLSFQPISGNDTLGTKEGMTPVSSLEKNPKHKNLLSQAVLPRCRDQMRTSWFGEQNLIRSRDFFCLFFVDDLLFTFPSSISAPVEWRMSSLSRLVNRGRVGGPGNMWHPLRSKGWNCPAVMTLYLWKL